MVPLSAVAATRLGSNFDDFLKEEGLYEDATNYAVKRVLAWQVEKASHEQGITKAAMARRMGTSRAHLDRLLDPNNDKAIVGLGMTNLEKGDLKAAEDTPATAWIFGKIAHEAGLPRVGVESRHADPRIFHPQLPDRVVPQPDDPADALLLHPVAGLAHRYMGGDVDHPELLVDQHHRIVLRMGEIGIDLRMS